jgi:hypothetical protein
MITSIKKHSLISIVMLIFFGITSCHEEINMSYNPTYTRLVVDGSITTDTMRHYVRLTKSGDALNQYPIQPITKAVVSITDGDTTFNLHEVTGVEGLYATDSAAYGLPGKTYTLYISNVDVNEDDILESYSATCALRKEGTIDSIKLMRQVYSAEDKGWVINLYGQDIGGGRNFYLMKAYKNGILLTDSIQEYVNIADNTGFEGQYYSFSVYYLDEKKLDERLKDGDTITLEMDGITIDYMLFLYAFIQEYFPKAPIFSGPSANVPTNVIPADKALGFFTAYSIQRKSVIFKSGYSKPAKVRRPH